MKYLKEFYFFGNNSKLKVGDKLRCIDDCIFNSKYEDLPRIYDYEKGNEYEIIEVDSNSVKLKSDRGENIFLLYKGDSYFPYLFDYFEEIK